MTHFSPTTEFMRWFPGAAIPAAPLRAFRLLAAGGGLRGWASSWHAAGRYLGASR